MSRLTADSRNYRWRRVSATEPPLSTPAKYLSLLPPREGGWRIFLEKESRKLPFGNCTVIASWRMCTYGRGSPFLSKILPNWPTAGQSKELCNCNCLFPPRRKRVNIVRSTHEPNYFRAKYSRTDLGRVFHSVSFPEHIDLHGNYSSNARTIFRLFSSTILYDNSLACSK